MMVVHRVVDLPSCAAGTDEPHAAKQPQLVRHGGLADADKRGDVADAQLAVGERIENLHARGVAKNPECVGQRFYRSSRQQRLTARAKPAGIEVLGGAVFGCPGGRCDNWWLSHMNI